MKNAITLILVLSMVLLARTSALAQKECRDECRKLSDREAMRACLEECIKKSRDERAKEQPPTATAPLQTASKYDLEREAKEKYIPPEKIVKWEKKYGFDKTEYGTGIRRRLSGDYAVIGFTRDIEAESSSAIYGPERPTSALFLIIGKDGEKKLSKSYFKQKTNNYGRVIGIGKDGKTVVLGIDRQLSDFKNKSNIILMLVDENGVIDEREIGEDDRDDKIRTLIVNSNGSIVMGGITDTFGENPKDLFIFEVPPASDYSDWRIFNGTPDTEDSINSIVQVSDGGYAAAGTIGVSEKNTTMFALKISPDGKAETVFSIGGTGANEGKSIIEAEKGNYVMLGMAKAPNCNPPRSCTRMELVKFKFGDKDALWRRNFDFGQKDTGTPAAVRMTPDGNYLVCGAINVDRGAGSPDNDALVFKVDPDGNLLWYTFIGKPDSNDFFNDIDIDTDGSVVMAGSTGSFKDSDVMVVKITDPASK